MLFATALIFQLPNPSEVSLALQTHLHFTVQSSSDSFIVLENGCLTLRLEQGEKTSSVALQIVCKDIYQESQDLLGQKDFEALDEIHLLPAQALEQNIHLLGLTLRLSQVLTEDDLDITPDLPKKIQWDEETEALFKRLLKKVPLGFRGMARKRITQYSEQLTTDAQLSMVQHEQLLLAVVAMTPAFRHQRLKQSMQDEGVYSDVFFKDAIVID